MSDFKKGDIVRLKGERISWGLIHGVEYRIVKVGFDIVWVHPVEGGNSWGQNGFGTFPRYLEHSSGCYDCKYACKMNEKRPLFEEE